MMMSKSKSRSFNFQFQVHKIKKICTPLIQGRYKNMKQLYLNFKTLFFQKDRLSAKIAD